jgi:hypothetical protein
MANRPADGRRRWRKILYEPQPFADNYCDEKFLEALRTNGAHRSFKNGDRVGFAVTAVTYTYTTAVHGALVFVHQLSLFTLYVTLHAHVHTQRIHAAHLLTVTAVCAAVIYGAFGNTRESTTANIASRACAVRASYESVMSDVRRCSTYVLWCWAVTPMVRTLTRTISTDTIYAMVTLMGCVHLACTDYGVRSAPM